MTLPLQVSDFAAFFSAVNRNPQKKKGPDPFPWQLRLVEELAKSHPYEWPGLLDLPTGSGKTATLDIAVFLQALRPDVAPRRIVFVVDRRVIVQQAFRHAGKLTEHLANPQDPIVERAADRLRTIAAAPADEGVIEPPLRCAELRGGIVRDESWAMRPDVPAILVSTVDQVGSRVLFRGYGVTQGMRPIHAGLLGNDVLFLLDEVHLSQPFAQTLAALQDRYRPPREQGMPERWQVVQLSATPGGTPAGKRFELDPTTDRDPAVSPVLHRRLAASKPARCQVAKGAGKGEAAVRRAIEDQVVTEVQTLLESSEMKTIAAVVNRVGSAIAVNQALRANGVPTVLFTGRMRPFDRDRQLADYEHRLVTGRDRTQDQEALVVVATQAIEAGADFDFDGLVTECASLDALYQRFGRVDRDGRLSEAGSPGQGVIVAAKAQVGARAEDDPVYGPALSATWDWLNRDKVDFGYERMERPAGSAKVYAPRADAPVLLPSYLDAWVQTSPPPQLEPEVARWLHGPEGAAQSDVNVVWRADLCPDLLLDDGNDEQAIEMISACPPLSGEALAVPLKAARDWLTHTSTGTAIEIADVEGSDLAADSGSVTNGVRPAVIWRPRGQPVVMRTPSLLRPGDTVVVPASYGGISDRNWDPQATIAVADHGTQAHLIQRHRAVLRLHPTVTNPLPAGPDAATINGVYDGDEVAAALDWLSDAARALDEIESDVDPVLRVAVEGLQSAAYERGIQVERVACSTQGSRSSGNATRPDAGEGVMLVITSRTRVPTHRILHLSKQPGEGGPAPEVTDVETVDSEPETSSFAGRPVELDEHLVDVERWARALATSCGLDPATANDVALAGRLHDLGKCDPGFQAFLYGTQLKAGATLLAKAPETQRSRRADRQARQDAGYPVGSRHELLSLALIADCEDVRRSANDWDLVQYLVTSHHGYGRPFAPVEPHREPLQAVHTLEGLPLSATTDHSLARLDAGVPDRFWRLVRRYGWHGLAWLESILRLADHRASSGDPVRAIAPGQGREWPQPSAAIRQPPVAEAARHGLSSVKLQGLAGTNPLGFLAALGVVVELHRTGQDPLLRWTDGLIPRAVVTSRRSVEEIVDLINHGRTYWLASPVLDWPQGEPLTDAKPSEGELRSWAEAVAAETISGNGHAARLWSSLLAEGAFAGDGRGKPTHLHFTAGNQMFLKNARELAANVDAALVHTALLGPWSPNFSLPGFRWNAGGERLHALRAEMPAADKPPAMPGADWLAWLGLSFYLVAARTGRNDRTTLSTTACDRAWTNSAFRWPLWSVPIGFETIRSLLSDPELVDEDEDRRNLRGERLRARGVLQVLEAPIRRTKGYGNFQAAAVLGQATPGLAPVGVSQTRRPVP